MKVGISNKNKITIYDHVCKVTTKYYKGYDVYYLVLYFYDCSSFEFLTLSYKIASIEFEPCDKDFLDKEFTKDDY